MLKKKILSISDIMFIFGLVEILKMVYRYFSGKYKESDLALFQETVVFSVIVFSIYMLIRFLFSKFLSRRKQNA